MTTLTHGLRASIKIMASAAKFLRREEIKALRQGRYMAGRPPMGHKKKHQYGEDKPDPIEIKFNHPENAEELSNDFYSLYQNLRDRRVREIRQEARTALLAYAFLRGKAYSDIESSGAYCLPDFNDVWQWMKDEVQNEDIRILKQRFEAWKDEALAWWEKEGNLNHPRSNVEPEEKVA